MVQITIVGELLLVGGCGHDIQRGLCECSVARKNPSRGCKFQNISKCKLCVRTRTTFLRLRNCAIKAPATKSDSPSPNFQAVGGVSLNSTGTENERTESARSNCTMRNQIFVTITGRLQRLPSASSPSGKCRSDISIPCPFSESTDPNLWNIRGMGGHQHRSVPFGGEPHWTTDHQSDLPNRISIVCWWCPRHLFLRLDRRHLGQKDRTLLDRTATNVGPLAHRHRKQLLLCVRVASSTRFRWRGSVDPHSRVRLRNLE